MKIIYNNIIPFQGFIYINLFGVLFSRKKYEGKINPKDINHESIHTEQYKDLGYILFLPLYLLEWLIKLPFSLFYKQPKDRTISHIAYKSISLEQEAYYNENDLTYLDNRKRYSWIKYIFSMYDINKKKK